MHKASSCLLIGVAAAATALASAAYAGGEAGKLQLRDVGAKFVGYTTKSADNGSVDVLNPMFVQYLLPERRRHDHPVVFIHGGGGQGTDWLETPDGRDGWVDYFVAAGWDVYVVDRPGHGRSQSNASCGNGQVRVGNSAIISRLSTAAPNVWPGGEPTPTNDAVIGWTASSATAPYCGDALAAQTISALLDQIGPAVVMVHSQSGAYGMDLVRARAIKMLGFINVEGNCAPVTPEEVVKIFSKVPLLSVWGDNSNGAPGPNGDERRNGCTSTVNAVKSAGGSAKFLLLPEAGQKGNSHMLMMDKNNLQIADLIIGWLGENVPAR